MKTRNLSDIASRAALGLAAVVALTLAPAVALACGAFVYSEHEERAGGMSDQEVLIAFGSDTTTVVVAAGYTDSADEFAFLLPVGSAPDVVSDGHPGLFYALEDRFGPRVYIIDETVSSGDSGSSGCGGCGGADGAGAGGGAPLEDVVVLDRGQTATYDYVVVGGTNAQTLEAWLTAEGFTVPSSYQSALDTYIGNGWFFLVARIRDQVASGQLAPIQLNFAAGSPENYTFPIGISSYSLKPNQDLSITLYLMGSTQILPANYDAGPLDDVALQATSPTTSNYDTVFQSMVDQNAAGQWVTERSQDVEPGSINLQQALSSSQGNGYAPATFETQANINDLENQLEASFTTSLWVTRLRTQLSADQLHDMTFQTISSPVSVYDHTIFWSGGTATTTGNLVDGDLVQGVGVFVLLLGFSWRRRRGGFASRQDRN